MEFTGERYVPGLRGPIELEHVHRYLQASRIAAGKQILDIASGEGYGSAMLAAHAASVIGVDVSVDAVEHARTQYRRPNLEFRVGTCADIPLADASVDLVVSFETIEHHDQHRRMMEEIKRVLTPRGVLLLSSPDKLHYTIEPGRLNPFHVKELYKHEFEELLSRHFTHTTYFAQRVLYGSGIFADAKADPLNSHLLHKGTIKDFAGLSDPTYWIVLASDGPLPRLTSSFLEQPVDEMEILQQLRKTITDHECERAHLADGISHRDGQIASLGAAVTDRDGRIADLSQHVLEHDRLRQAVTESQARIEQLTLYAAATEDQKRWQESLLRAAAFTPLSLRFPNAWVGHLPFAAWLIETVAPSIFVELGTHTGNSFFSFCQAVAESGIGTRCYAVDTWRGDEHAGLYDESVFDGVCAHQREHYREFSTLLRVTFDEALTYFSDRSVALLHIDGLHTYDAVRRDFESWLPKLSPGAVVLFHDTNVRERNFGVWRLWEELQTTFPCNLEFQHSHGLGVLQLNNAPKEKRLRWLEPGAPERQTVVDFFTMLGLRHLDRFETIELRERVATFDRMWTARNEEIIWRDTQIAHFKGELAQREANLASLNEQIARMRSSRSWRMTAPLRTIGRHLRGSRADGIEGQAPASADLKADRPSFAGHLMPLFDKAWYLERNQDVREAGYDALDHFARHGWKEGRDPHPAFNVRWYVETYPDVRSAGVNPLEHFLEHGWKEGRSPNPEFDLAWYVKTYEDVRASGTNPLIHYIEHGAAEGRRATPPRSPAAVPSASAAGPAVDFERQIQGNGATSLDISLYLPQCSTALSPPDDVEVDVIVPVYRGLEETRRCLTSLLADTDRPKGLIRVIEDCSPDRELTAWLASLAATGVIELSRNTENLGFVRTVNRGMSDAGNRDVLLLNSDTEVTGGFLRRLAGHAYSKPRVGSVTPFSNTGGEFAGFPGKDCRPLPAAYSLTTIDEACRFANSSRSVEIPTGVGYCLYIRRACLDEVGLFDADAFGRGYGEETDFCRRALKTGWRHLLACNTFVYHKGEVSFGADAPERAMSWSTLVQRHPDLAAELRRHLAGHPTVPAVFAATVALFNASPVPTVLVVSHGFDPDNATHVGPLIERAMETAHVFAVSMVNASLELSVPSIPGHPRLTFPGAASAELSTFLRACSIRRVHVQHWMGIDPVLHELVDRLAAPLDLTVHDYLPA